MSKGFSVCIKYLCYNWEVCFNEGYKCKSEEEARAFVENIIKEEGAI